jgi:hypothetical protein
MLKCTLGLWDVWPGRPCRETRDATFRVGYDAVLKDLSYELERLSASDVVLQLNLVATAAGSRRAYDGWPRAGTRTRLPGVLLGFRGTAGCGSVQFAADTFSAWDDNLRAIGLTLQRLRDVERYGAVTGGQQYRGFAALPPAPAPPTVLSIDSAARMLSELCGGKYSAASILGSVADLKAAYREASYMTHSDLGGSDEKFRGVLSAYEVVRARPSGRSEP